MEGIFIRTLRANGVTAGMTRNPDRDADIGRDYLAGASSVQLAARYEICPSAVRSALKRNGIERRKGRDSRRNVCKIDDNFFRTIDSHLKAQILGFIFADGCVAQRTKRGRILQIILHQKDAIYLESIRTSLNSERPLVYASYLGKDGTTRHTVRFATTSPTIVSDLERYGVVPRKSLVIGFPTEDMVPSEFLGSFILGVFEGDGSISLPKPGKRKHRCADISVAATVSFNTRLAEILSERGIKSYTHIPPNMVGKNFSVLRIGTVSGVRKFYDLVYANATLRMDRKRKLFEEFLSKYGANGKYLHHLPSNSVTGYVRSADGVCYSFNVARDFAVEQGLNPRTFREFVGRRGSYRDNPTHRGWTLPTPEEIIIARAAGTLVTRLYRQPAAESTEPVVPFVSLTASVAAA